MKMIERTNYVLSNNNDQIHTKCVGQKLVAGCAYYLRISGNTLAKCVCGQGYELSYEILSEYIKVI